MDSFVNGTVNSYGGFYANGAGTPKLEIRIQISQANGLPYQINEHVSINLIIEQVEYRAKLHSTKANKYVWVSPVLSSLTGQTKNTLGRVLTDSGYQANDPIRLTIKGETIFVHRD